jgi:lysophospholipid acyltransferase (LPLAT)-like uncharacterized protein
MKITHPFLTKSLGLFGATLIRALAATLDYRIVYQDPLVDPIHPRNQRRGIYILWHEYMLLPVGVRGKGLTVLVSQHRDGELITQVLRHLKFQSIRGSTTRGGVAALRQMLVSREACGVDRGLQGRPTLHAPRSTDHGPRPTSLILTPDGPRGPRRHLAEGSIFLASRLQLPIVCMGFGFDRPWRQKSWDRFAIPRPFSRARAVISPYLELPPDLDRTGFESYRIEIERILNQVTREAEVWAESGRRRAGEMPLLRNEPAPQMAA